MRYPLRYRILVVALPLAAAATAAVLLRLVLPSVNLPLCPSDAIFHVYCPGCGATRAVAALCRGNILLALRQNAGIVGFILVLLLYYLELVFMVFGKRLRIKPLHNRYFIIALSALWVLYAVVRNFVPALAPV